ncbi:hypothetical protein TMEN_9155 [Trichophyton mentagrophytes]|nr:hypothetical protein TMEN_9155 [Trichophyton mentagrophytes]
MDVDGMPLLPGAAETDKNKKKEKKETETDGQGDRGSGRRTKAVATPETPF